MSKTDAQRLLQRRKPKDSTKYETEIPEEFLCPITQDVMKYPVLCSDGFVYEKGGVISEGIFNFVQRFVTSTRKTENVYCVFKPLGRSGKICILLKYSIF